jgi:hypothetical protein
MYKFLLLFVIIIIGLNPVILSANDNLADQLSGRILLQVEEHGEAWYVNPETKYRHF